MENIISLSQAMKQDKNNIKFNYICEECSEGIVEANTFKNYQTKINGYPFVVPEAIIGICNECGAEHFSAEEHQRWEKLYYQELEQNGEVLSAEEIVALREKLGLSQQQFASFLGCTWKSIYNWEKPDRNRPQSRMADLLLRLLENSFLFGNVDVLSFLLREAKKMKVFLPIDEKIEHDAAFR
jgi:putative zinc finger/helix-turn-helix YgiT family protein